MTAYISLVALLFWWKLPNIRFLRRYNRSASSRYQRLQSLPQPFITNRERECRLLGCTACISIQRPRLQQHHWIRYCSRHGGAVPRLPWLFDRMSSKRDGDERRVHNASLCARLGAWSCPGQLHQVSIQPEAERQQLCRNRDCWRRQLGCCSFDHKYGYRKLCSSCRCKRRFIHFSCWSQLCDAVAAGFRHLPGRLSSFLVWQWKCSFSFFLFFLLFMNFLKTFTRHKI